MTTGAGRELPDDAMVTTGDTISVVVRLSLPPVPPGRNSVAEPSTVTASPTVTVGGVRVKTRMPSLVARSPSPTGSCIQKPELLRAVTIPATPFTGVPAKVERCAIPWICEIVSTGLGGGATSQVWVGVVLLTGEGAPAANSVPFWSPSTQASIRATDVVLLGAGAGPVPSKTLALP